MENNATVGQNQQFCGGLAQGCGCLLAPTASVPEAKRESTRESIFQSILRGFTCAHAAPASAYASILWNLSAMPCIIRPVCKGNTTLHKPPVTSHICWLSYTSNKEGTFTLFFSNKGGESVPYTWLTAWCTRIIPATCGNVTCAEMLAQNVFIFMPQ